MSTDLTNTSYFQSTSIFAPHGVQESPMEGNMNIYGKSKDNPFVDSFPDPLCKLHLRETAEFVKSFPISKVSNTDSCRGFLDVSAQRKRGVASTVTQRRTEAPSTPGRPVFSFSTVGNLSRKSFPSKWDDAEKWLISGSCHDSPCHTIKLSQPSRTSIKPCDEQQHVENFADKLRVTEEKVSKAVTNSQWSASLDHQKSAIAFNGVTSSTGTYLKDKFTNSIEHHTCRNHKYLEPTKEGFLFRDPASEAMKDAYTEAVHEVHHRDVGTEMTPLGSSTTSRCHTPFKSSSPARHNTPASRSGPLAMGIPNSTTCTIDITQLAECHLAKLQVGTQYDSVASTWSSRKEEEEDISKSLRHFESGNSSLKTDSGSKATAWEEEEKNKCCLRYQREEAKIQAWINLQNAKAEAQSKKLEVKIEKMRANLEERLMKRMALVHRKADEWRASARQQHSYQIQRVAEQGRKLPSRRNPHRSRHSSCGCFPCNNSHYNACHTVTS